MTKMVKRFNPNLSKLGISGLLTGSLLGVLTVIETVFRVELIAGLLGVTPLIVYLGISLTALVLFISGASVLLIQYSRKKEGNKKQINKLIN